MGNIVKISDCKLNYSHFKIFKDIYDIVEGYNLCYGRLPNIFYEKRINYLLFNNNNALFHVKDLQ